MASNQTAAGGVLPNNTGTIGYGNGTVGTGALPPTAAPPVGGQQQFGGGLGSSIMGLMSGGMGSDLFGNYGGMGGGFHMPTLNSDPSKVSISPDILNSMQQYSDAAYNQATRTLDPQWQQQAAAFQQQMVGQGLTPGSQAYDAAYKNFMMGQNDAYAQARNQAMQQGLQAQGQSFQEGLANSQLANELAKAGIGADAQISAAGLGASASMHDADVNAMTQRLLGLGNLGIQYGNLQNSTNATDFGILNGLTGAMNAQGMYNNGLPGMQIGNFNSLYQNVPHGGPAPVDVTGAYQMNQNGQLAGYNADVANSNSQNQMYGALGSAAIMAMMMNCSRVLKDDQGEQDAQETLEAVKALPLRKWTYKGEDQKHIGTYAEEFHAALGLPKSQQISVIDMFGALLGSVQAINTRLEKLERRSNAN